MHSSEIWHRFFSERRYRKYAACKYPNLVEIFDYFPTYYFAEVTDELMLAVFRNEEDLTREEMQKIAYYNGIPLTVLLCPRVITLSNKRRKHREMVDKLQDKLHTIEELQKKGSRYANNYLHKFATIGVCEYREMVSAFQNGKSVTYGRYLGVSHQMDDCILFAQGEKDFRRKPRGLKKA